MRAHRNFLRDAVYFLYEHNRLAEAAKWYSYLGSQYPDQPVVNGQPNSLPRNLPLDQYAVGCVQEAVSETMDQNRVQAVIEGLVVNAYSSLTLGQDDRAAGFKLLAEKVRATYVSKTKQRPEALPIPPVEELQQTILQRLLDPKEGLPYAGAKRCARSSACQPKRRPPRLPKPSPRFHERGSRENPRQQLSPGRDAFHHVPIIYFVFTWKPLAATNRLRSPS